MSIEIDFEILRKAHVDFQNYAEYVDNASFADISVDINLAGEEGGKWKDPSKNN